MLIGLIGLGFNVNLGALLVLGLGVVLTVAEAYTPGFGELGGAGIFCVTVGSLLLISFTPSKWAVNPEWYGYFH
ncbi:MAG: hypothetical protein QW172_01605, partial [Candidatus Bathyarchaeia archaeon]